MPAAAKLVMTIRSIVHQVWKEQGAGQRFCNETVSSFLQEKFGQT